MKKSPKIDLNKAKILFQRGFLHVFQKYSKNFISFFYVKKTIKECPAPLYFSIKSNRKHHKTVLYSKSNKNMFGWLFGQFFIVFGRFFNKNIWSPCTRGQTVIFCYFPMVNQTKDTTSLRLVSKTFYKYKFWRQLLKSSFNTRYFNVASA